MIIKQIGVHNHNDLEWYKVYHVNGLVEVYAETGFDAAWHVYARMGLEDICPIHVYNLYGHLVHTVL